MQFIINFPQINAISVVVDELTMFVFVLHCSLTVFRDFIERRKVSKKTEIQMKRESYIILVQTNFGKTKEKRSLI